MYVLLIILGALLIVLGAMTLFRTPRTSGNIVWGVILIVLGIIALPSGLSLH